MPAWWNTLSKLSTINSWLLGVAAFAGFFAAVFGVAAWKVGDRVTELQEQENFSFRSESEQKIAEAKKGSAEANERAQEAIKGQKKLEAEAEQARLKQREAERETAEIQLKVEQEKVARLKLEEQVADRKLTTEQKKIIKSKVLGIHNPNIGIWYISGSGETAHFARDIQEAFRDAGLMVSGGDMMVMGGASKGITMTIGRNRLNDAEIVAKALQAAGVVHDPVSATTNDKDQEILQLTIWPK